MFGISVILLITIFIGISNKGYSNPSNPANSLVIPVSALKTSDIFFFEAPIDLTIPTFFSFQEHLYKL